MPTRCGEPEFGSIADPARRERGAAALGAPPYFHAMATAGDCCALDLLERAETVRARAAAARARADAVRARAASARRRTEAPRTGSFPALVACKDPGYTTTSGQADGGADTTVSDVTAVTHPSRDRHKKVVGANIRAAREAAGLSQTGLGLQIGEFGGKTQRQVSDWERGIHKPHHETVEQIAVALDRPASWFYVEHGPDDLTR
jgi:DNA-binding transcriptional regulator YiaG